MKAATLLLAAGWALARIAVADPLLDAVLADPDADDLAQGRAVADAAARADAGFADSTVSVRMVLHDGRGRTSERALRILTLEGSGGSGDRTLIVFDAPATERGTALLTWNQPGDDDQWLYLPALKRVKKIAARNRSGPFVGSEFAFEDLTEDEIESFVWRLEGTDPCGDDRCYRVERVPVDPLSGYARQLAWYETETLRLIRVEYFDRKNAPMKVLETGAWTRSPEGFWRAHYMDMRNGQTRRRTELHWSEFGFGEGLDAADFTTTALQRIR
jgi:hypothetical protein